MEEGSSYLSYDKIARQWTRERMTFGFVSQCILDFADRLPSGGHILDLGCGSGMPNASYLASRGFSITGIDASASMIQLATEQNMMNAQYHHVNMLQYAPLQSFDGVLAWDSLFHLPYSAQHFIYQRIASWMLPGAWFLFTHGNKDSAIRGDDMYGEKFFYSALDTSAVIRLLGEAGFQMVTLHESYTERDMDRDLVVLCQKSTRQR